MMQRGTVIALVIVLTLSLVALTFASPVKDAADESDVVWSIDLLKRIPIPFPCVCVRAPCPCSGGSNPDWLEDYLKNLKMDG